MGFKLPVSVAEAIDAEALERGRRATKSDVVRDALISFPPIQRQLSKRPRAVA